MSQPVPDSSDRPVPPTSTPLLPPLQPRPGRAARGTPLAGERGADTSPSRAHARTHALGINTKSAAALPDAENWLSERVNGEKYYPVWGSVSNPDHAAFARCYRYELQSVSRDLLPAERVSSCLLSRLPHADRVKVMRSPEHGTAHYANLMVCGSVHVCPVCAAKIAERRREELAAGVAAWRAAGGVVLMLTYTASHGRGDALRATLSGILDAQHRMTGNRPYKRLMASYGVIGAVKALEVTWGERNGWHPHCHTLLFLPAISDVNRFADALYECWRVAAAAVGLVADRAHGLDVRLTRDGVDEYIAKYGRPPVGRPWSVEDELTKLHTKRGTERRGLTPFDLLRWYGEDEEARAGRLFVEFAGAFKGRRQLTWSRGLRDRLQLGAELEDAEVAAEVEEGAILLASLSLEAWRAVKWADQRGEILEAARTGDALLVHRLVSHLVRRYRAEVRERQAGG